MKQCVCTILPVVVGILVAWDSTMSPDSLMRRRALPSLVSMMRAEDQHPQLSTFLRSLRASASGRRMHPQIDYLIAENALLAGDTTAAISAFRTLGATASSDQRATQFIRRALEDAALLLAARGDTAGAVAHLERADRSYPRLATAESRLLLVKLYAGSGQRDKAERLLAIPLPSHEGKVDSGTHFLFGYEKRLLDADRAWIRKDRAMLVRELSAALRARDVQRLRSLASPLAFFESAMGTEPKTVALDSAFAALAASLKNGRVDVAEAPFIRERTEKAYVFTSGWATPFTEHVWLWLRRTPHGWEWSGVVYDAPRTSPQTGGRSTDPGSPDRERGPFMLGRLKQKVDALATTAAAAPADGQPLRFTLKAPWKSGKSMLSGKRFQTRYGGSCTELYGITGDYYGQGGHTGGDHYAIDFGVWETDWIWTWITSAIIPYWGYVPVQVPVSGMEVRSVAPGIVVSRDGSNGKIAIRHLGAAGVPDGYESHYLHMSPIWVHTDDYVARGTALGKVDDKGNSTGDHLHFALFDASNGGNSVMLNPLNGSTRDADGDDKCIESSNSELFTDADFDDVPDAIDNCLSKTNPSQADRNGDYQGDACDDSDGDFALDDSDNCWDTPNYSQFDRDSDGRGDECDSDRDGDGRANVADNCPNLANADQANQDADASGDLCDDDIDGDGWANVDDYCPVVAFPSNADQDGDRLCDITDNCPAVRNSNQADVDGDGLGDLCDSGDFDGDGIADQTDNCPAAGNANQSNVDGDALGDACDPYRDIPPPPEALAKLKALLEAQVRFASMNQGWRNPIGPLCLTCPPEMRVDVSVGLVQLPQSIQPVILDATGKSVPFTMDAGGRTLRFRAHARTNYELLLKPKSAAAIGVTHNVKFDVRSPLP
jgi:hypothetical protein